MRRALFLFLLVFFSSFTPAFAISDPRDRPNNKVGINILSPEADAEDAGSMVNQNGDWGFVVLTIKKSERNVERWEKVFNRLNRQHLIPVVRIAADFDSEKGWWQRPAAEDAKDWADFLNKLPWPVVNRYVQVYNEVNRASEWGGSVDAADYSKELEKTIDALKAKSSDFFILNAPLDLSLATGAGSLDAEVFLNSMNAANGIFEKIDGLASHSYPNPGFAASPLLAGRTGIAGYKWELDVISQFTKKNLPVFITETGWIRSNGLDEFTISQYFKTAFEKVWADENVVLVSPFVYSYSESLFEPFSFSSNADVLGKKHFDYFYTIKNMPKVKGEPERENIAFDAKISNPYFIVKGLESSGSVSLKNNGNFIWRGEDLKVAITPSDELNVVDLKWNKDEILPGETAKGTYKIKSNLEGKILGKVKVFDGRYFLAEENIEVKSETFLSMILRGIKTFI